MLNKVAEAIEDIRQGKMVIVVDDENRENEGDIIFAASASTPEKINFLIKKACGLICVALTEDRVNELNLPLMVQRNTERFSTAFTISVEVREGTTTGISASDRSKTAKALADSSIGPMDLMSPGHIFPLRAQKGGVLVRAGHTEAAVDLVAAAGLGEAGVICEILNDDGTMARLPDLRKMADKHDLKLISIADLISYRRRKDVLVKKVSTSDFPTQWGMFEGHIYRDTIHGVEHLALVKGEIKEDQTTLVRVHSECLTGDVFGSPLCSCGESLSLALKKIQKEGGVLLYLRKVDKEIGLDGGGKSKEVNIPEPSELPGTMRTYGIGAQILSDLGIKKMKLLSNHTQKRIGLESYGLEVLEQTPLLDKTK